MRARIKRYRLTEERIRYSDTNQLDVIRGELNIKIGRVSFWLSFPMFACDVLSFIGFVIAQFFLWYDIFSFFGFDTLKVFSGVVIAIGLYCLLKTISIFMMRRGMSLGLRFYCWLLNSVIIILVLYFFMSLPFFRSTIPGFEGSVMYSACSLLFTLAGKAFIYTSRFDRFMLNNLYELTCRRESKISQSNRTKKNKSGKTG